MAETIIIIALLVFIAWQDWQRKKERQEFFDYIKAKDINELKEIRRTEKPTPLSKELERPDLEDIGTVSDEVFDRAMKKELGRETFVEKAKETISKKLAKKVYGE